MPSTAAPAAALEVARSFAKAYAAGDTTACGALLHPRVREREITPGGMVDQLGPQAVVQEASDFIAAHGEPETLELRVEPLGPLVRWSTRWRMPAGGMPAIVEWHAFLGFQDGLISRIDAVCSGLVPEA